MERDQVTALRRVAIVLSSLPETMAQRLIAGLGSDQQRAVQMAVDELSDVDPLERQRTLDGFTTSIRQGQIDFGGDHDAAEIVLSSAARDRNPSRRFPQTFDHGDDRSPLGFLAKVDDNLLAEQIRDEHPQTIAIVLAAIAPAKAARLLPKLSIAVRTETMRRLAKLEPPAAEVVTDIADQLRQKLPIHDPAWVHSATGGSSEWTERATSRGAATAGQVALRAIMAEMESPAETAPRSASADTRDHRGPADSQANGAAQNNRSAPASPSPPEPSAETVHRLLVSSTPERLREALAKVDGRQALLTLCGLPTATAEALLQSLPRRQARRVRKQLIELGTIELRDIDRAKRVAAAALDPSLENLTTEAQGGANRAGVNTPTKNSRLVTAA